MRHRRRRRYSGLLSTHMNQAKMSIGKKPAQRKEKCPDKVTVESKLSMPSLGDWPNNTLNRVHVPLNLQLTRKKNWLPRSPLAIAPASSNIELHLTRLETLESEKALLERDHTGIIS